MSKFSNSRPRENKEHIMSIRLENSLNNSLDWASKTLNMSKGQFIRSAIEKAIETGSI